MSQFARERTGSKAPSGAQGTPRVPASLFALRASSRPPVTAPTVSNQRLQRFVPLQQMASASVQPQRAACPRLEQDKRLTAVQTKLAINQPGDVFELEADRVADAVMRMADPAAAEQRVTRLHSAAGLQRCSCGKSAGSSQCEECKTEAIRLQRSSEAMSAGGAAPPIVHEALSSSGRPLDAATRSFMEPRFGHDFSDVRVHTDARATESARAIDALAYTVGNRIVFGEGSYTPTSEAGQRILAHELTHVIQQGSGSGATRIQRACKGGVPKTLRCVPDPSITPPVTRFLFNVDCDDFAPSSPPFASEEARMDAFAKTIPPKATISIVGLASFDGPSDLNERLSCRRAQRGLAVIKRSAPPGVTVSSVDATVGGPATAHDRNMRAVGVSISKPIFTHHFRAAAWSFLSCAACNPFTDDGTLGVTPPPAEPSLGSIFRQMHFIEAELGTRDSKTIEPGTARLTSAGADTGVSHFCGAAGKAPIVTRVAPGAPTPLPAGAHGEGVQLESETFSRVGASVPPTIPGVAIPGVPFFARGAPCGPLGGNPAIPLIGNRFRVRLFADGTKESEFVSSSLYPSHNLYEDSALKLFGGKPVHPAINFFPWATSTGVPLAASIVGFKALRFACCHPFLFRGACDTICVGGFTAPGPGFSLTTCVPLLAGIAAASCPTPCAPAGGSCPPLVAPPNP